MKKKMVVQILRDRIKEADQAFRDVCRDGDERDANGMTPVEAAHFHLGRVRALQCFLEDVKQNRI
jgi:hypothetical protein